ncbi:MAG: choice-of-anchor L domain-containing protein [Bacteroidetes bacterium]|nr:choice-of-anchor L domain-containing protein [Bacteroidota bacterium]
MLLINKLLQNIIGLLIVVCCQNSFAQLIMTPGGNPTDLVNNVLLGSGVTAQNVTFTGSLQAIGTFTTGITPTNLGVTSGIAMASGNVTNAIGPNTMGGAGNDFQLPGDSLLDVWTGQTTHDAVVLEFDFIPQGDTIKFRYVFGSEEYPEFVYGYNDIFGFFLTGFDPLDYSWFDSKNIALVPGTNLPVSIFNINDVVPSYPQYYVNNSGGTTIQYDGFTTVLTAWALVVPCIPYHIKLAVADAVDGILDSGVFLEAGSFTSGGITTNISFTNPDVSATTSIEGCNDAIVTFKMPHIYDSGYVIPYSILAASTATYGVDYDSIPNPLTIPPGGDSVSIVIHAIVDGITEGPETVGLVVPNTICMNDFDTIFFTILDYTPLQLAINLSDTLIPCGQQITLKANKSNGQGPFTYHWSTNSFLDSTVVTPTISTLYYVTVSDGCGNFIIDSAWVHIFGPVADAGLDTSICIGGTATLRATGGTSYLWSNGLTTPTIQVNPIVTTKYLVTVTASCFDTASVTVHVNPLPLVIAAISSDSVCPGEQATLTVLGAAIYSWTSFPNDPSLVNPALPNPVVTPPGSVLYTVTGTDTNTCVNTASVIVVMKPSPSSGFSITNTTPCIDEFIVITFTGNAPADAIYHWDFDGGSPYGAGMGPYQVSWTDPGEHILSLFVDRDGCLSPVFSDTITAIARPHAQFTADKVSGCPPLEVNFTETSTQVMPGTVYEWFFGNGDHSLIQDPYYGYNKSGVFDVTLVVSNLYGCNDTLRQKAFINVYPVPEADMAISPQQVSIFEPFIKFYDRSLGSPSEWLWDFGDGNTGNEGEMSHTYADTGIFLVSLTVKNIYGCVDSIADRVWIRPDNTIYFPNAFSPNGDGYNDVFRAYGTNIKEFHMQVFDRWGELIHSSDDIDTGWNGYYKGNIAQSGVYTLIIRYRDALGSKHSYYGKISLIR